jgi:hypothetical protein
VKTRHQFVAVPEDAKLSCTAISYSSTGVIYRIKRIKRGIITTRPLRYP